MPLQAQTQNNITAFTGFGQFDLQLAPVHGGGLLNVNVRLRYVDVRANPTATLQQWANQHAAAVANYWNNKIRFRSAGGDVVSVRFNVSAVTAGEHFAVRLNDGAYGSGSGLKFAHGGLNGDPCNVGIGNVYLDLNDPDCLPYYLGNATTLQGGVINPDRMMLLMNERTRIVTTRGVGAAQADFFDVPLTRNGAGWTVSVGAQAGLTAFCQAVAATPGWLGQPGLVIHATSGIRDKLTEMLNTVERYLRAHGVTGQIGRDPTKTLRKFRVPFTAHAQTATVRVEIADTQTMVRNWQSLYCVAAHEFGHCIGLPDEYLDYSNFNNMTIRNSQPRWDQLCGVNQANVPTRNWHGQFNDSMMSIGDRLYPCHAVTLWKALDDMTQNAPNSMNAQSWTIEAP
jgi:hypothetical protein